MIDSVIGDCDGDGVCHAAVAVPAVPLGLHEVCVEVGGVRDCSPHALAIVDHRNDPVTVVHLSDAHIGDGDAGVTFHRVLAAIAAARPDFVVFTGDGANDGLTSQREEFVTDLEAFLPVPIYVVTGNHDYDNRGIDGHLIDGRPRARHDVELRRLAVHRPVVGAGPRRRRPRGHRSRSRRGPDDSQLAWLVHTLDAPSQPTVFFLHHPIYNGLFATVGPDSRDRLKALVTRDDALAVLAGHTHITSAYDADGNSRDLSLDAQDVDPRRLPLHYTAARSTNGRGGYALFHLGAHHVDYRWIALPLIVLAPIAVTLGLSDGIGHAHLAGWYDDELAVTARIAVQVHPRVAMMRGCPKTPRASSSGFTPACVCGRPAHRGSTSGEISRWSARRTWARTTT